jgi:hypothetical protein
MYTLHLLVTKNFDMGEICLLPERNESLNTTEITVLLHRIKMAGIRLLARRGAFLFLITFTLAV